MPLDSRAMATNRTLELPSLLRVRVADTGVGLGASLVGRRERAPTLGGEMQIVNAPTELLAVRGPR
jgi:signal transduction histidine kinase